MNGSLRKFERFLAYFSTSILSPCDITPLTCESLNWQLQNTFSDPIFPLTLLTNNQLIGMLDGVFQITFICAILLFWLCIYHGLRQVRKTFFFTCKPAITGRLNTFVVEREKTDCVLSTQSDFGRTVLAVWRHNGQISTHEWIWRSSFQLRGRFERVLSKCRGINIDCICTHVDKSNIIFVKKKRNHNAIKCNVWSTSTIDLFQNIKTCVGIFVIIYIVYLVCLILRAYSDLRSMPYFGEYSGGLNVPTCRLD